MKQVFYVFKVIAEYALAGVILSALVIAFATLMKNLPSSSMSNDHALVWFLFTSSLVLTLAEPKAAVAAVVFGGALYMWPAA